MNILMRIGWTCGCWVGYPNRWYKRTRLVRALAKALDPWEQPGMEWSQYRTYE